MSIDARALRNTSRYRKARLKYMKKHPLCVKCLAEGLTVAGTELDHILPVHTHPELFWDEGNWQSLCYDCHKKKSDTEHRIRKVKPDKLFDAFNAELEEIVRGVSRQ